MRVLITGASGQVGVEAMRAFADHDVAATDRTTLDLGSRDSVLQAVTSFGPDVIIHAGAMTNVDGCELFPDDAYRINSLGTRHVADAARRTGAYVCYLSTDYVFPGDAAGPYREWDDTGPISVYGRSKLGGEREIDPAWSVVRTSWVCGATGANFVKTMLRLAADGTKEVKVVDDQLGNPTFAADLVSMIRRLSVDRRPGTFHVTNQGAATWFEFARSIFAAAGETPERVKPITTAQLEPARPAPRPRNSVLDNAALRLSDIPLLPHHQEPLERLVRQLVAS